MSETPKEIHKTEEGPATINMTEITNKIFSQIAIIDHLGSEEKNLLNQNLVKYYLYKEFFESPQTKKQEISDYKEKEPIQE